jgi:hypothetical protein
MGVRQSRPTAKRAMPIDEPLPINQQADSGSHKNSSARSYIDLLNRFKCNHVIAFFNLVVHNKCNKEIAYDFDN